METDGSGNIFLVDFLVRRIRPKSFMDEKGQYFCSSDIPDMLFTFSTIVSIVLPSRPNKCIPLKLTTAMDDCTFKVSVVLPVHFLNILSHLRMQNEYLLLAHYLE